MFSRLMAWLLGRKNPVDAEPDAEDLQLPTGPASRESPRDHHYVFVHQLLPRWFFGDPAGFIDSVTRPAGLAQLQRIWEDLGSDVKSRGGVKVPVTGLATTSVQVRGQPAALLLFPRPEAYTEAYLACLVITQTPQEARLFVLERTLVPDEQADAEGRAVLCEWLEGGRRRNHQSVLIPKTGNFLAEVERMLQEEERRRQAAAPGVSAPTWDVAGGQHPMEAMVENEPFRFQPCLFAFHLLPHAAFSPAAPLAATATGEQVAQVVDKLWRRAALACGSLGHRPLPAEQVPQVKALIWAGDAYLLIRMPEALSAPEPLLIAVPRRGKAGRLFLLESSQTKTSALLTTISAEGVHALHGVLNEFDEVAFMNAISALHARRPLPPPEDAPAHLVSYPRIAKAAEHALPDIPPPPIREGSR